MAKTVYPDLDELRSQLQELLQKTLPSAATSKNPSQSKWPVHVDDCFERIILDNMVGVDTPWVEKLKSPAYKSMSREQLEKNIRMARKILDGEFDLTELDNNSLALRGKEKEGGKRKSVEELTKVGDEGKKRKSMSAKEDKQEGKGEQKWKRNEFVADVSPYFSGGHTKQGNRKATNKVKEQDTSEQAERKKTEDQDDLTPWLKKIARSQITDFQKKVLTALCQVPKGKYTTYAAISNRLSSSPRAVGNALKNNPFAPQVPCHRVLATGGGLGGFQGSWGRKGEAGLNDDKKRKLLMEEGVKFDSNGKVIGIAWNGFS